LSPFIIRKAERFFILVLDFYLSAARRKGLPPVLVLENLHHAEGAAAAIFLDAWEGIKRIPDLLALGTWDGKGDEENLAKWEGVFSRTIGPHAGDVRSFPAPEMPVDLWEIGYAIALLGRYFPPGLFPGLFEEEGKNPAMIGRALSMLAAQGIIDTPESLPWMADFVEQAEEALGKERRERAQALVRGRLLDWMAHRRLNPCFRFLMILADLGGGKYLDDTLILRAIRSDLVNGTAGGVERAREAGLLEDLAGRERGAALRSIVQTMRALIGGDEGAIHDAFRDPAPECGAFPVLKAQSLVNLASYLLGLRDNGLAMQTIKEVSILSQRTNSLGLAQLYRLFSMESLSRQQIGEALDYLGFAMDNAEKNGDHHEMGVSAYFAASVQFLYGNVSRALALAGKAREQALAAGCPEWADRSHFLEGRLAFETGRYQEALDMFEQLRKEPQGGVSAEKERLLAAWAYRSRVYFENPQIPKPAEGGHDADLFEVEAAYLSGNYRRAAELAAALGDPPVEEHFLYTEQPDWRSGFAQCEFLYFSRGEVWDRMICAYHSLALCRLSGGEEAVRNMQRIVKDEQFSEMDPGDTFYFYAWYRILEQSGASQVDINTAISIAFKRLQRRAGHVDDMEIRRQFLFQPRWNSALAQTAREYKLI
jgi:tetratricopeptide (TPR) repeat protein